MRMRRLLGCAVLGAAIGMGMGNGVRGDTAGATAESAATTQPGSVAFTKPAIAAVTAAFKSGDGAKIDEVLPTVRGWFDAYHVPAEFWKNWMSSLVTQKRFADIADLCQRALAGRPDARIVHYLMPHLIEALLEINQPADALQAAKSYYNIADSKDLANAIGYLNLALNRAHPDDPQMAAKFLADQSSTTAPTDASVLQGVTVDEAPYRAALAHWRAAAEAGSVSDGLSYASVLLMADHPAEAEPLFRKLLEQCKKKADIEMVTDDIAASLRAQDGNSIRAAQYLASTPPPATAPARAKKNSDDALP